MQIHCLTSIIGEKVDPEEENESDESDDEDVVEDYKKFKFTQISIEYEEVLRDNGNSRMDTMKEYSFTIYRPRFEGISIKMLPGAISIEEDGIDQDSFTIDIKFGENLYDNDWRLLLKSMHIRNIKNVTNLSLINEDQELYEEYMKRVLEYREKNVGCAMENAFNIIRMKSDVVEKTLKQTIRAIRDAIIHLCDPINGSYKNVPDSARYKNKASPSMNSYKKMRITSQKEYQRQKTNNKKTWLYLEFNLIDIARFDNQWFDASYITTLSLVDVDIADQSQDAWNTFANGLAKLKHLHIFTYRGLTKCSKLELPDIVYQKLPLSLRRLNLMKTNLTRISPEIGRLTNLITLILSDNSMLTDDTFPWEFLPINIEILSLSDTAISEIPKNIGRLKKLQKLYLSGLKLKSIAWTSLSNVVKLSVGIFNDFDAINISNMKLLNELEINTASNKVFTNAGFPRHLLFRNSLLEQFYFSPNIISSLDLSNNKLKTFPWESIPQSLGCLILSKNELKNIGSVKYWKHLSELDLSFNKVVSFECDIEKIVEIEGFDLLMKLNFSHNKLQSLPLTFEKLIRIRELDLSKNEFNPSNLNESLWNRLPLLNLRQLNISENNLSFIPCILKQCPLYYLDIQDCNLSHICPHLLKRPSSTEFIIDMRRNNKLKHLSYIPKAVLPPNDHDIPYKKIKEMTMNPDFYAVRRVVILADMPFRTTANFRTNGKYLCFNFKKSNDIDDKNYCCNCCARCDQLTDEPIVKELMTMDIAIVEQGKINNKLWEVNNWRSVVKTKLCAECKIWYQNEARKHIVMTKRKSNINKKPQENEEKEKQNTKVPREKFKKSKTTASNEANVAGSAINTISTLLSEQPQVVSNSYHQQKFMETSKAYMKQINIQQGQSIINLSQNFQGGNEQHDDCSTVYAPMQQGTSQNYPIQAGTSTIPPQNSFTYDNTRESLFHNREETLASQQQQTNNYTETNFPSDWSYSSMQHDSQYYGNVQPINYEPMHVLLSNQIPLQLNHDNNQHLPGQPEYYSVYGAQELNQINTFNEETETSNNIHPILPRYEYFN